MYTVFFLAAVSASLIFGTFQQCCVPTQLQTFADGLTSLSENREGPSIRVHNETYDALKKRRAFQYYGDQKGKNFNIIYDYKTNTSYTWTKEECVVSYAGQFIEYCFSGGKLVRKTFMGVYPDIIELETYLIPMYGQLYLITLGKNCTPVEVVQMDSKPSKNGETTMWIYYNMTIGIKDESVFIPPKMCFKNGSLARKALKLPNHRPPALFGALHGN